MENNRISITVFNSDRTENNVLENGKPSDAIKELYTDDAPTFMCYSLIAVDKNGRKITISITKDEIKIFD